MNEAQILPSFDEEKEINDNELDQEPEMKFFATGNDGNVIKLQNRIASIPISFAGQQFQHALENEMKDYTNEEIMALAPFQIIGRGIAGIDEMAKAMDDNQVFFGLLQIQIGQGTFARHKNIFIHFQGHKMKPLQRARANKKLSVAKKLIGHTHAPLIIQNKETCTVEWVFAELKRVFEGDSIAYKGKGKQTDLNTLKVNYKLQMEQAKVYAQEEMRILVQEKLRLEREAKEKALEEEKKKLQELKREAAKKKKEMEAEKKRKAEEERRVRHEREEKKRLERKRIKQEQERKSLEAELKKNPHANIEELKKKKKKKRRKKKKKDDWSDDKPWTPQRVLAAIHAELSPINWGLFKPSQTEIKPMKWGHGSLNVLRQELKDDQVQYGLIRLSFGSGRFRRSHWVYFLWTPDSMSHEYKKGNKRMKHVSYNGEMQKLLKPWTLSLTVETKEKVTIKDWILRVKKTVVVDGGDELFSEEAFKKALQEECEYAVKLKEKEKELTAKRKQSEEIQKIQQMKEETRKRQQKANKKQNTFSKIQLKQVTDSPIYVVDDKTPTVDKDGNYYVNHDIDYGTIPDNMDSKENDEEDEYEDSSDDDKPREPSPEPVIELTAEELAILDEERKKREAEELAKRTENEIKYRKVLQSKMVLESVELCKRTSEKLCWILFAPRGK